MRGFFADGSQGQAVWGDGSRGRGDGRKRNRPLATRRMGHPNFVLLHAFVDGVVGLVAPGGVEGWVQRGSVRGAQLEVILQRERRVGVVGGDGGFVKTASA